MKAVEFCYWLQGYFELTHIAEPYTLTGKQVDCIKAHLALVAKVDPNHDSVFVEWLDKYLEHPPHAAGTARIKRLLASQFRHVIDPSYGGNASALQAVHDGNTGEPWRPDALVRC